jgi:hypothetical protein
MSKIVLLLFVFSQYCYGETIPFKKFFNFIENEQDRYFSQNFSENSCAENLSEKDPFNIPRCIANICGDDLITSISLDENPYMVFACAEDPELPLCKGNAYKKYFDDFREIRSSIKEYFPLEQDFIKRKLQAARLYLKEPENVNSPLDSLNMNLSDLLSYTFTNPDLMEFEELEEGGIGAKFKDEKKLKKKLRSHFNFKKSEARSTVNVLKVLFEDSNLFFALEYFGKDFVLDKMLNPLELKDPIGSLRKRKYQALDIIKSSLKSKTIDPESVEGSFSDQGADIESLLMKVMILEPLSTRLSQSELLTLSKSNYTRVDFYKNPKFSPDWSDPSNKDKFHSTLTHIEAQLAFYEGSVSEIDSFELNGYMMTFFNSLETLPSKEDVDKAKVESKEYLGTFFKAFASEFSKASTEDIQKEVGSLHINYSETKKQFIEKIKRKIRSRKGILLDYKKLSESEKKNELNEILGRGLLQDLRSGSSSTDGLDEFVDSLAINPIPDFYLGAYNGIKMGPLAIKDFSNKGKQILAHELGHHVGHFMEKHGLSDKTILKFKNVRECLSSSHGDKIDSRLKVELATKNKKLVSWNEDMYSEEDFSDWIASKASDTNMACLFVKNMEFDDSTKDYFENKDKKDTHSSALYRLLNIELNQKGKLPPGCQTVQVKLCPQAK